MDGHIRSIHKKVTGRGPTTNLYKEIEKQEYDKAYHEARINKSAKRRPKSASGGGGAY